MIDDQSPKEVLLREICNMRHQLTTLRATEVEYKKLKRDIECFSLLSQEMLCIIEIDGSFTYLNHATEKILGYTRDRVASGRRWFSSWWYMIAALLQYGAKQSLQHFTWVFTLKGRSPVFLK